MKQSPWTEGPIPTLFKASVLAIAILGTSGSALADKGAQHLLEQPRPGFLGVSGSNINFLSANGSSFCVAGTLGALLTDGSNSYILSNNHVLALENTAHVGDQVIQPGLLDENGDPNSCSAPGTDYAPYIVGQLSNSVQLSFGGINTVDAAIAAVDQCKLVDKPVDCIDPQGRILDIGGLSGATVSFASLQDLVGLRVQKSGRTTGLTTGTVSAVNVNVTVSYDFGNADFVDQILVSGDKGAFIKSGDSGSLMVTRPAGAGSLPDAVGLLFAGSASGVAIANRIDKVLQAFGMTMVGCSSDCANTGSTSGGTKGGGSKSGGGGGGHGPKSQVAGGLEIAAQVRDRHESVLRANPDVVGTGVSVDENGAPEIQIYTRGARRLVGQAIPASVEGINVRVVVTGDFKAL